MIEKFHYLEERVLLKRKRGHSNPLENLTFRKITIHIVYIILQSVCKPSVIVSTNVGRESCISIANICTQEIALLLPNILYTLHYVIVVCSWPFNIKDKLCGIFLSTFFYYIAQKFYSIRNNKCSHTISTLYIFKHLNITSSSQIIKIYTIKMKSHALIRQQFVLVIFQNLLIIYDFHSLSQREKSTALSSCEKKK